MICESLLLRKNAPGAETHLTAIENLLQQNYLHRHPEESANMVIALFLMGLLLSFILSRLSAVPGLIFAMATISALYLTNQYYFFANGWFVSIVFPFALVGLSYVGITFF